MNSKPAPQLLYIEALYNFVEHEPGNPDIIDLNALLCAELGDSGRARNIWTDLLQTVPDYAPVRINLNILDRSSADHNSTFFSSRTVSLSSVSK